MNEMLEKLKSRKGQVVTITTERAVKVKKGMPAVTKKSKFQCRVGVTYDNIQAVKDKRASGELPAENQGLPWGEWIEFPYIIGHKDDVFVRCTTINSGNTWPTVYVSEGREISVDSVKQMAYASEFAERERDVFNIRVSSLQEVK